MNISSTKGPISKSFSERGITNLAEACRYVKSLSYRRNSTKEDQLIVLKEECGTCSSKHELVKRLAEENDFEDYILVLCMFEMSGYNTPKVKSVLDKYGIDYIPEAHTYITMNERVLDLTFPENLELLYQKDIIYSEEISADQIKAYKVKTHQSYIKKWITQNEIDFTFEQLWNIREECIAALAI